MKDAPSSSRIHFILEKTGWHRLNQREKVMVGGMLISVATLLFFSLVVSPLLETRTRLQKSLLKKEVQRTTIQNLQKEYETLRGQSSDIQKRIEKRAESFSLFSFIEQQATDAGIKEQINYIKPTLTESDTLLQESRVDMKLQQIQLDSLVTFLQGIESPENVVAVDRVSIQAHDKKQGYLDVVIRIVTFRRGKQK